MPPSSCQFFELEKVQFPLVNQFYKRVYKKGVASKNELVFILKDKEIVCSAKLKTVDQYRLLTGVACEPTRRGKGYASHLINNILLLQNQSIYCFPYPHLQSFYSRLGFIAVDSEQLPEIIRVKFTGYSKNRPLVAMLYPKTHKQ